MSSFQVNKYLFYHVFYAVGLQYILDRGGSEERKMMKDSHISVIVS